MKLHILDIYKDIYFNDYNGTSVCTFRSSCYYVFCFIMCVLYIVYKSKVMEKKWHDRNT